MIPPEEQADKVIEEYLLARESGLAPDIAVILKEHPSLTTLLENKFEALSSLDLGFKKIRGVSRLSKIMLQMPSEGEVLGDFQLIRELGSGGNGVVYLARQQSLKRLVALKILRIDGDSKAIERFQREAETIARLRHERIASVHAFGMLGEFHYLALEYMPGIPLSALISRLRSAGHLTSVDGLAVFQNITGYLEGGGAGSDVPVPPSVQEFWSKPFVEICCRFIVDIADALAYAHAQGVIHRDIKPSNIIVGLDGHATLIDFGLTKNTSNLALTQSTDFLGTIYYASPEQVDGDARKISPTTDIYSLGATFYELLTWSRPFDGASIAEVARKVIHSRPIAARKVNSKIPSDLQVIIETCLQKESNRRYANAEALKDDIERFLSYQPILAKPPSLAIRGFYAMRRRPRETAGLAVIVILFSLLGGALRLTRNTDIKLIRERSSSFIKEGSVANNLRLADWAIIKYGDAIKADPGNCNAYLERARVYILQKNDTEAAERDMAMAQQLPGCDENEAKSLFSQLAFAKKDFPTAIKLERQIYSKDRTNADSATRLAAKLSAAGKLNEAKGILLDALQKHPTDYMLNLSLGWLEDKRKQPVTALQAYQAAYANLPKNAQTNDRTMISIRLSQLYWDRNETEKAIAVQRDAIRAAPNDVVARQGLVSSLLKLNRHDEVEAESRLLMAIDQKNPFVHQGLALVYASTGKYKRAIDEYEKAIQLGGKTVANYSTLALIYEETRELQKAKENLEAALSLDPKNEQVKTRLKVIGNLVALTVGAEKRKPLLAQIKADGGYVDELKGVGFEPPYGWVRHDMVTDPDGIYYYDERSEGRIKPNFRFGIETPDKTPENYFLLQREQFSKVGLVDISDLESFHKGINGRDAFISRYSFHSGNVTARVVRYDIRAGHLAYIFTCVAPLDKADVTAPACERAVNTAVLGD